MNELADVFAELDDPRAVNARRHSLHDILVIALCTVISGGQTCTDMEPYGHSKRDLLQSFLKLENGIPNHVIPLFTGRGTEKVCFFCHFAPWRLLSRIPAGTAG